MYVVRVIVFIQGLTDAGILINIDFIFLSYQNQSRRQFNTRVNIVNEAMLS